MALDDFGLARRKQTTWSEQFVIMMRKNYLFLIRSWKTTLLQVLAPLVFVLLLLIIDQIPKATDDNPFNPYPQILNQKVRGIGKVPQCDSFNGVECMSIRFTFEQGNRTGISDTEYTRMFDIMDLVREDSGLPNETVRHWFGAEQGLNNYIVENPNATQVAIVFYELSDTLASYNILYNGSFDLLNFLAVGGKPDSRNELQVSVDKAIVKVIGNVTYDLTARYQLFPQLGYDKGGQSAVETYGAIFFYCGLMFQYVMLLYRICSEKDLKLRQGLKMIGLRDSVYWASWFITALIVAIVATFVLLATGYATQLAFFLNSDFSVLFLLFFLFSISVITFAFLISTFVDKAKSSLNVGMLTFVLGLLFVSIIGNSFTQQAIYDPDTVTPVVPTILSFLPPFNLAKIMADVNDATSQNQQASLTALSSPPGFRWENLYDDRGVRKEATNDVGFVIIPIPRTVDALNYLVMDFFVFGVLAWYLDNVLASPNGEPRKWYFLFTIAYWFPEYARSLRMKQSAKPSVASEFDPLIKSNKKGEEDSEELSSITDEDVRAEYHLARSYEKKHALRLVGLRKQFTLRSKQACGASKILKAVDGVSFVEDEGRVLGLLGHNGAGKTTTINMLNGLISASGGDAYLYGYSIRDDMDSIHDILGVCPQHDILWNDLNAAEHVEIFARLKGMPKENMENIVREVLTDVRLYEVRNNTVDTYSGGMRRRLSVALSFLGDPKVVFLDEPTTGMDPSIRRDIWNLILRKKEGRVMIMTSHSLEEIDVIADKIAVIALGQLKVVGSSVRLKNRFAGYRIAFSLEPSLVNPLQEILTKLPGSPQLFVTSPDVPNNEDEAVGTKVNAHISLPPLAANEIAKILALLEEEASTLKGSIEWGISQTTLEEVFLKVTGESNYSKDLKGTDVSHDD